jgi:outer membrane protein OmpA-like peptidoglycan-associated protein
MLVENIFRKAGAALAVGAYALFIGATPVVKAQVPARVPAQAPARVPAHILAMEESRPVGPATPEAVSAERIVLHGLRFQAQSNRIEKSSVPMLDYALQIIKQNPESLVYVNVRSVQPLGHNDVDRGSELRSSGLRNSELTNRRAQAVVSYFERKGISAKRLVLAGSGGAPQALSEGAGKIQNLNNFEVVQLDFATEAGHS